MVKEKGRKGKALLPVAVLGLLSVMVLIANVGSTELGGEGYDPSGSVDEIVTALLPVAFALWVGMFVYLLYSLFFKQKRVITKEQGKDTNGEGRWLMIMLIIGLGVGLVLLLVSGPLGENVSPPQTDGGGNGSSDTGPIEDAPGPQVDEWSLVGICIVGVALLIPVLRYLYGLKALSPTPPPHGRVRQQANVLQEAVNDIVGSTGDELRDSILKAYHSMCLLLVSKGEEDRALTPREFAERAITVLGWPEGPVRELTGIFELARYSHHNLGERERERALVCLAEVQVALGKEVKGVARTAQTSQG